jgi:N-sulphoglucosamine sulphohydrolase, C-terminal
MDQFFKSRPVTNGRYKLTHHHKPGERELFDLKKDSHEMRNFCGTDEYADVQRQMKAELARLREELQVGSDDPL